MALTPGTHLGTYEVLATIGAGGMGEVYRARDSRLQREVAIKILPDIFAADPDRLARFEREATTLAALNHPNIAQVYGFIEAPPALVMELVAGEDLAARVSRGPVPIDEAIAIARQIADALEAAHDQSIVHRDLKPANVRIRPDGTVKVLDFGLAKSLAPVSAGSGRPPYVDSPTLTSPAMTALGMIVGTAAYMAPEQARGKPVDRRADVWAFGCVLYEMLTGTAPFSGEDTSLTLAAILTHEADWSRLPSGTPAAIRRVLRRCLEKDPKKRLNWIGDARLELEDLASEPPVTAPLDARNRWMPAYVFGALLAGASAMWLVSALLLSRSTVDAPPDFTLRRLTELPGAESAPDISPDGRQVVFASNAAGHSDIYLLRVGGARAINLTAGSGTDNRQARFSPDGERIAFRSERDGGGIFVMGSTGESVRRVTTAGFDPAWSPDGKSIAYATEGVLNPYARNSVSELWTAETATGRATRIFAGDAIQPAWSPDGRRIAFWANAGGQRDLWTIPAAGGTPVAVTKDAATDWSPEWSPDGRWLYFSSDRDGSMNLWRIPTDAGGTARGDPQPVTRSLTGIGYARSAADGSRMSVMAYSRTYELSIADFDATGGGRVGAVTTVRSPSLGWCSPSPAADWLVCTARGAQEDIVLMRSDGSETVRLMDDAPKDRNPTWSPDGSLVAFMSTRSGKWELWSMRRDGSDLRQMTALPSEVYEAVWSADMTHVMTAATTRGPTGTWLFDAAVLATQANARLVSHKPTGFTVEALSPDGTIAAGAILGPDGVPQKPATWDPKTNEIRQFAVPILPDQEYRIVTGWFPDSRRFLVPTPGGLAVVDARSGTWSKIDAPANGSRYRLSADGRKLMIEREVYDGDVWLLEQKR